MIGGVAVLNCQKFFPFVIREDISSVLRSFNFYISLSLEGFLKCMVIVLRYMASFTGHLICSLFDI